MSFPSALLSKVPEAREQLSVTKKRKRDDTRASGHGPDIGDIDRRPFVVRPAGSDPFSKTRTFTPVCVITRAQLPLAWLDTAGSGSQLFAADVRVLEAFHVAGEEGRIVVAEEKEDGRLFAVERTARRVYALCRLGQWVGRQGLDELSSKTPEPAYDMVKRRAAANEEGTPWWSRAIVEVPTDLEQKRHAMGMLDMSLRTNDGNNAPKKPDSTVQKPVLQDQDGLPTDTATVPRSEEPVSATTAQDSLEELSRQYLDALYLSRTSLAYFAKGPLSRARGAFTGMPGSETHIAALTGFLRESVLTSTVMDKKYRDTLPAMIKELAAPSADANDKSSKSKRKKKWKAKRDKAGLFSNEQEYLQGWWHGSDTSASLTSPETSDLALKRRMPALRSRETYLQIIVILETLVLDSTSKNDAANVPQQEATEETQGAETQELESQAVPKRSRTKKPQDLHSLLETLLDRLCIWHSLESHTPAKSIGNNGDAAKEDSNDELRNFCIEVIVPFFMSRLPKEAILVNKKLGGPNPPSPAKRKTTSSRSKPGEPAARRAPPPEKQARKPLSRVPTEILNQPTAPTVPGLHRSATDSQIKREDSDVSLSSIPPIPQQSRKRRSDLMSSFSSSLGHREVDLDAKAAAAAAKLKKREEQDAQVRDAINAIKKPNRTLANKDVAARADERFAQSLPGKRLRPQLHQAQSLPATVHVTATPKRGSKIAHAHSYSAAQEHEHIAHGSGHSMVPSSSIRYRDRPRPYPYEPSTQAISSTPAAVPQTSRRASHEAAADVGIEDTPSRARAVAEYPNLPAALTESPIAKRTSKVLFATPRKTSSGNLGLGETPVVGFGKAVAAVQGTPMKDRLSAAAVASNVGTGREEVSLDGNGRSIYDALGWDDEEYEELA